MSFSVKKIEEKIGYTFHDSALLIEAFTHSTYANAHGGLDNERMEYLGDAVLQLVITEWQYARGRRDEGALTSERQKLVCEDALYRAVERLGLRAFLRFEGSASNVGKKTVSSLFETVTAAIYLDGGYEEAKHFVLSHGIGGEITDNPKGDLQEYLQKRGQQPPVYSSEKFGKDNQPTFVCTVTALDKQLTSVGGSKKEAEMLAARGLLALFMADEE